MYNMIEGFKHKINQLTQNCSKLHKNNAKLKRIINNTKIKSSKRKRICKIQEKKYAKFLNIINLKVKFTKYFFCFSDQLIRRFQLRHS